MPGYDVCVFGSFIVDIMARTPRAPVPGETVRGTAFAIGPGGKGSNQCIAAKRAGASAAMVSRVGSDRFAGMAFETLEREGIATGHVFRDGRNPTGTALIMVEEESGNNRIVVTPGACEHFTVDEVESARPVLENCNVFVTQLETNLDAMERALRIARDRGALVILNPAPACEIPDSLLPLVDICTPNESEARALTGMPVTDFSEALAAARALQGRGVKNIIITMGEKGALAVFGPDCHTIESCRVKAVDTTGAGDAFNGGLAAAIARGSGIVDAARFASAVAALSVTKPGTAPAMPYRPEIEKFMAEQQHG